ncbi:Myosin-9 [Camellia lanceoleosa]|uniref:Myosin-9 n=1 Tax=Camellia lanceoleosa TaxID=1840588 RepID=A0ACC0HGT3_9ERIC|nr:Myosin-9 [Camellia lanceoleosa]
MKEDSVGQSEKIVEACREWGCFRIINHGVPPELMAEMKAAAQSLMELPVEIKRRCYHPVESHGYVSVNKVSPVYESLLACYDSCVPGALDNFLNLMAVSSHLRETVVKYFEAMNEQALDMGRKLGEGMGLKRDLFKDWSSQMRLNKYHFNPEFVGSCALYLRTDPGFLTILQDDEIVGGLEVVHGKTGECVHVDPMPDSPTCQPWRYGYADRDHEYCNPTVAGESPSLEMVSRLVTGGEEDPLVDSQKELVKVLEKKGVEVRAKFGEGDHHAVELMDPTKASAIFVILRDFIFKTCSVSGSVPPSHMPIATGLNPFPTYHSFKIGKTKVFLRAGQMAELDARRAEKLNKAAKTIQRQIRTHITRKWFIDLREASVSIQSILRGRLACKIFDNMKRVAAALKIQTSLRRHLAKIAYTRLELSVLVFQTGLRAMAARNKFRYKRQTKAAIIIQAHWRGHRAFLYYKKLKRASIVTQCRWRGRVGRKELRKLKMIWSNGRLPSVKHKVQCYEGKTRFSTAFFVFGPNDRGTEQPPELVDSQHPRLYNPINFEEYRLLRISNNLPTGAFELLRINS